MKECSNMFGRTGAPRFRGPTHVCQKFMRSKLPNGRNKGRGISEQTSSQSMHYCIQKFTFKQYDKNWTEHGHLAFYFDPVGRPHKFFRTGPKHTCDLAVLSTDNYFQFQCQSWIQTAQNRVASLLRYSLREFNDSYKNHLKATKST